MAGYGPGSARRAKSSPARACISAVATALPMQRRGPPRRSVAAFVLEGELELHAVRQLVSFDVDVLLDDLGHAQVPERLRRLRDGRRGGLFPGISAAPHERDHLVDAVWHGVLLPSRGDRDRGALPTTIVTYSERDSHQGGRPSGRLSDRRPSRPPSRARPATRESVLGIVNFVIFARVAERESRRAEDHSP